MNLNNVFLYKILIVIFIYIILLIFGYWYKYRNYKGEIAKQKDIFAVHLIDYIPSILLIMILLIGLCSNAAIDAVQWLSIGIAGYFVYVVFIQSNRLDITGVSLIVLATSIVLAIVGFGLTYFGIIAIPISYSYLAPLFALILWHLLRIVVKLLVGHYPIPALRGGTTVKSYHYRYKRKVTSWDVLYSILSTAIIIVTTFVLINYIATLLQTKSTG